MITLPERTIPPRVHLDHRPSAVDPLLLLALRDMRRADSRYTDVVYSLRPRTNG